MWYGLTSFLVLYLFLVAGLSREHVNAILTIQQRILILFKQEEHLPTENDNDNAGESLPADIRPILRHPDLEPVIRRAICCPRCFEQYAVEACPAMCDKRQAPKLVELLFGKLRATISMATLFGSDAPIRRWSSA